MSELSKITVSSDSLNGLEPHWWKDGTLVAIIAIQIADISLERYARLRALWVRVIVRAAYDVASHKDDKKVNCRKWAEDAERWLFSPSFLFNSFENICFMLSIDPEKFRSWAKNLTKDEVRKLEHMERSSSVDFEDVLLDNFRPDRLLK